MRTEAIRWSLAEKSGTFDPRLIYRVLVGNRLMWIQPPTSMSLGRNKPAQEFFVSAKIKLSISLPSHSDQLPPNHNLEVLSGWDVLNQILKDHMGSSLAFDPVVDLDNFDDGAGA